MFINRPAAALIQRDPNIFSTSLKLFGTEAGLVSISRVAMAMA